MTLTMSLALIREKAFSNGTLPTLVEVIEDVDVSTLDDNHILPNVAHQTPQTAVVFRYQLAFSKGIIQADDK